MRFKNNFFKLINHNALCKHTMRFNIHNFILDKATILSERHYPKAKYQKIVFLKMNLEHFEEQNFILSYFAFLFTNNFFRCLSKIRIFL